MSIDSREKRSSIVAEFLDPVGLFGRLAVPPPAGSGLPIAIPVPGVWRDTANNNSLSIDDTLFQTTEAGEFQTLSPLSQINSTWIDAGNVGLWNRYTFDGEFFSSTLAGEFGVSFHSQWPTVAKAYRLTSVAGAQFRLTGLGSVPASGDADSGVVPVAGTWYRFRVFVRSEDDEAGERTRISAKIWPSTGVEPSTWQIECWDQSPTRLDSGSVGVYSSLGADRRWRGLSVSGITLTLPDYVAPAPPPTGGYGGNSANSITDDRGSPNMTFGLGVHGTGAAATFVVDRFYNGDWFIVAPSGVRITTQNPAWTGEFHGAEKNPTSARVFGYNDARGFWDAIDTSKPLTPSPTYMPVNPRDRVNSMYSAGKRQSIPVDLMPGDALVVGVGITPTLVPRNVVRGGVPNPGYVSWLPRPVVSRYVIVTVVDALPAQHSVRPPPYLGSTKKLAGGGTRFFNLSDVAGIAATLPKVTPVSGQVGPSSILPVIEPNSLAGIGDYGTLHSSLVESWKQQYWSPGQWYYGQDASMWWGHAFMALCSNYPDADKTKILMAMLQFAVDNYAPFETSPFYMPGYSQGGLLHGKCAPIFVIGNLLGFSTFRDILLGSGNERFARCAEINQCKRLTSQELGWLLNPSTSPNYASDWGTPPFIIGVAGEPHWIDRGYTPNNQNKIPGKATYQVANCSPWQIGQAIGVLLLECEDYWGSDDYPDYMDWFALGGPAAAVWQGHASHKLFYSTYRALSERDIYEYP